MPEISQTRLVAHELVGELIDVCVWLADGRASPEQFRAAVVDFEKRKHERFGYTLHSAVTECGHVQFSLRHTVSGELCASLDVHPATGQASVQQAWD